MLQCSKKFSESDFLKLNGSRPVVFVVVSFKI